MASKTKDPLLELMKDKLQDSPSQIPTKNFLHLSGSTSGQGRFINYEMRLTREKVPPYIGCIYMAGSDLVDGHYVLYEYWNQRSVDNDVRKGDPIHIERWPYSDIFGVEDEYPEAVRRLKVRVDRRFKYIKSLIDCEVSTDITVDKNL